MSVTKRGKVYHLRIRPFGSELITVATPAQTKSHAVSIERAVLTACRAQDFRALDPESRAVCMSMYRNRGLELPPDLGGADPVREELTLWRAIEIFVNYPSVKESRTRQRYVYCLAHVVRKLGKDRPLKTVWVPDLRLYQSERTAEGASAGTINWELASLSRLFGVMIELQFLDTNPVRLIKRLSCKEAERQVYLSFQTVQEIAQRCPLWCRSVIWAAYYSGMRRGELLGLTWKDLDFSRRMITLSPEDTKEARWKRVPVHMDLLPILEDCMTVRCLASNKVFLLNGRPPNFESIKNPWRKAVKTLALDPRPHFHDLRATFKTNCRRSGMHPEIEMAIMGHSERGRTVHERYGRIGDRELIEAIDRVTFDHGPTEVLVARR